MAVEFDIKLTVKDMYRFKMYQIYAGVQGWISVLASAFLFWLAADSYGEVTAGRTALYVLFGILFLFYFPLTLYLHAKQSIAASKVLQGTLHFAVGETGFTVSQGEETAELKWEQIYRMVATRHNVLVYSSRIHAYVIPKEQLGGSYSPLAALANQKLEKHRVKMR